MRRFAGLRSWVLLSLATLATPLFAAPADDIHARVTGLRELGAAFKAVNDALRADEPQLMLVRISARQIVAAARDQYHWFPAGTGPDSGTKTAARAEIWSDAARFRQAQGTFAQQAAVFQQTTATGNVDAIRAEARKLGSTCKSCHDGFRMKQD